MQNNNFLPEWEHVNSSVEEPTLCGYNYSATVDAEDTHAILADYFMSRRTI